MKLWNMIIWVSMSLLTPQVFADVHLTTPTQLMLQVVNGEKVKDQKSLTLQNGKNQIAFRYEARYREGRDDVFFSSDIILMTFEGHDQDYIITLPELSTQSERDDFNNNPIIILKDKNGEAVQFEQGKLLKNGMQFDRDLITEMAAYNQTSKPASLNQISSKAILAGSNSEEDVAGEMLDYWYSKANKKTQDQFKQRINQ